MISLDSILDSKFPNLSNTFKGKVALRFIKATAHENEISNFIKTNPHLEGFAFLDEVFKHLSFSYQTCGNSLKNIPSQGRVIIVANHPIGTLDGFALLKMVRSVRKDVKIVANDILSSIQPIRNLLIPVDNMSKVANHKSNFLKMVDALENEEAIIIFPAGEVSRAGPMGIMDSHWKTGFARLAKRTQSPVLPMHIKARNSLGFYAASAIYKPLGSMLLMHEMFTKHNQNIKIKAGKLIPWESIRKSGLTLPAASAAIKIHTYKLLKYKNNSILCPFTTIETIAIPACRQSIRDDLKQAQHIMKTPTGLDLYMVDYKADSAIIHELGRIRELTFRKVGEGTGSNWDLDKYDRFYRHLILWDDKKLELVGGYRLGECGKLIETHGQDSLYMNHMYHIKPEMKKYLPSTLELGRCFVQPQYWGTRALDYLWMGMGNYIANHPEIKYLVGSISLSNSYSARARELIVSFYNAQLAFSEDVANARCPFIISDEIKQLALNEFTGDYKTCFKRLNQLLKEQGETLPMLFKQYVELCEDKGTQFIDFSLAPDFNNCIGSLIIIEIDKVKMSKRRYLKKFLQCA